jgi:hypothetical protein
MHQPRYCFSTSYQLQQTTALACRTALPIRPFLSPAEVTFCRSVFRSTSDAHPIAPLPISRIRTYPSMANEIDTLHTTRRALPRSTPTKPAERSPRGTIPPAPASCGAGLGLLLASGREVCLPEISQRTREECTIMAAPPTSPSFKYQEGLGRDKKSQWLHGERRARLNFMDAIGLAIVCPTLLEWFVS